jgi:predicted NAD-dependent protein-ADP-ribosyltransferase YbiA (DUF1768 family)
MNNTGVSENPGSRTQFGPTFGSDGRLVEFYDPDQPNGWLADFSAHPIVLDHVAFPTIEHYFQSEKFIDPHLKAMIRGASSPAEAKGLTSMYRTHRRADWLSVRDAIMRRRVSETAGVPKGGPPP